MVLAPINHITLDDRGIAYVNGSTIKVAAIAIDATRWSHTPDEIQASYPALSLSQIHAALAYYYDHREEMEAQFAADDTEYEALRAANSTPLSRADFEARLKRG